MRNFKGSRVVTINTRLRALRAFYNFLYKQKHISNNPMENIKLLKDRKTVIATFTIDQLNRLFKQPDLRTFTGVREMRVEFIKEVCLDCFGSEAELVWTFLYVKITTLYLQLNLMACNIIDL